MRQVSLTPSHYFQLLSHNPMQQHEQSKHRCNQHYRVKGKHAKTDSEVTLLQTEEHVGLFAAAIIVLFHLRLRDQIRHLLVDVDLFGCDRALRVLEERGIESLFVGNNGVNEPYKTIDFLPRTPFKTRKQCQDVL